MFSVVSVCGCVICVFVNTITLEPFEIYVIMKFLWEEKLGRIRQEAQLSQRGRAMLRVCL